MDFPVEDVETNVRLFLASVKRATGNAKDTENADRKAKNASGRHGKRINVASPFNFSCTGFKLHQSPKLF